VAFWQSKLDNGALIDPMPEADRASLTARLKMLQSRSAGGGPDELKAVRNAVMLLLSGYPNLSGDPKSLILAYVDTLKAFPAWAVEQACSDIRLGKVDGVSPDFAPTAARLAMVAESILAPVRTEAAKIARLLSAPVGPQFTPEHRERMVQKFNGLLRNLKNINTTEGVGA